jgi:leucyl aminopeptidase
MKLSFIEHSLKSTPAKAKSPQSAWVLMVADGNKLSELGKSWDKLTGGMLTTALSAGTFSGKKAQCISVLAPRGLPVGRIVLAGIGEAKKHDVLAAQSLGGKLVSYLNSVGVKEASVFVETAGKESVQVTAANVAYGARLKSYRFDKYRTKEKAEDKPTLDSVAIACEKSKNASAQFDSLEKIASGVLFTRDLVSEPANVIYPESLAARAKELTKLGVKVEVLGEAAMKKLGMGSLLGVGQGSAKESQLVVMSYNGGKAKDKPVAFVGKGVTFDSGGISLKPGAGMEDMKWDMGGAGTVIGLMMALAGRKAKVNVVGVVGLVENMPDGNAQRPSDVVKSMSGQTIEIINTDAEGRLVLADALWYTQDRFKPKFMVNLATLTGAIIISLGSHRAGLFSNNDKLADQLFKAGEAVGEPLWRLPLGDYYDKLINSPIADMANSTNIREAGSITAAQFLQRFVNDVPWAHLDIAGVAWTNKDHDTCPKGATAFGVRLLNQLVEDHYE